jgi:hypothetical protein
VMTGSAGVTSMPYAERFSIRSATKRKSLSRTTWHGMRTVWRLGRRRLSRWRRKGHLLDLHRVAGVPCTGQKRCDIRVPTTTSPTPPPAGCVPCNPQPDGAARGRAPRPRRGAPKRREPRARARGSKKRRWPYAEARGCDTLPITRRRR